MSNKDYFTADYKFILKEIGNGYEQWALECYPETTQLPFRKPSGTLYINFSKDTPKHTVDEIHKLLKENVINFSFIEN
jgi:hypothetical protein